MLQRLPSPLSQSTDVMMLGTTLSSHIKKCIIKGATGKILLQAPKIYGLYCMDNELPKNHAYQSLTAIEIHKKLGHISYKALRHLLKHRMILGIELNSIGDKITCDVCIKSKITCKPLPKDSGK